MHLLNATLSLLAFTFAALTLTYYVRRRDWVLALPAFGIGMIFLVSAVCSLGNLIH